jgi:hypothetical protein
MTASESARPAARGARVGRKDLCWACECRVPSDDELNRNGFVQVCNASNWAKGSAARAARNPASRRIEVDNERGFLGIRGKPEHYVIFIIPPQR